MSKNIGKQAATNGKVKAEVIQRWADGPPNYTYERSRLDVGVRAVCFDDTDETPKSSVKLKRDQVDFIVNELLLPRPEAEEAIRAAQGDFSQALIALVAPANASTLKSDAAP